MSRFASAPWPLRAVYIGAVGAAALGALSTLSLVIALAGLKRLSGSVDFAAAPAWFWYFRADPQVRHWLGIGVMFAVAAGAVAGLAMARGMRPPLHGAARWAGERAVTDAGLRARQGIVLGRKAGRLLVFGGSEHLLLYAPTRSGKGVGLVIPNLLTWPDSLVVLDVKRENWDASAGYRAAHGQQVILFDPMDPEGRTARFNPLGHIDRTDAIAVLDELQKLAMMLFPAPASADPFWAESARTGFVGVGAYVAETAELAFSLGQVYAELTNGDPRTRLAAIVAARAAGERPLSAGCANALTDFCSASENTFAGIRQTITSRMNLWLNPRVRAATEASDFDLRQIRTRRMSIYLCVTPDNLARVAPLYNLLLQQLVDLNTRERPGPGRHNVPVLVLLDEFARLGHAAVIAHGFSYVAAYGLRLFPVLQSPSQLRAEYGPDLAQEIIANCGAEVAFAPKELKVANDLSERLGYWTYAARSSNRPSLLSRGQRSLTESDHRRALMMPQELIQMPSDRQIILRAGMPPVLARKIVYWREAAFRRRVLAPPPVAARPCVPAPAAATISLPPLAARRQRRRGATDPQVDDLASRLGPTLEADGFEPLPPSGATEAEVEAWVARFVDASMIPAEEPRHGR